MKSVKPSQTLISAARAVVIAQAFVETLRPIVNDIQQNLLDQLSIKCDPALVGTRREVEGYLTPKNAYTMSDEDAAVYYEQLDQDYRKAGYTEISKGQCPLLLAEDLLRKAERLFMEASIELTSAAGFTPEMVEGVITCSGYDGLNTRKKYLDLNLSYVVPFIPQPII